VTHGEPEEERKCLIELGFDRRMILKLFFKNRMRGHILESSASHYGQVVACVSVLSLYRRYLLICLLMVWKS
jgi:hypothetical protein